MEEDLKKSAHLRRLVTQRKQRPSYTRMISWEFSQAVQPDTDRQEEDCPDGVSGRDDDIITRVSCTEKTEESAILQASGSDEDSSSDGEYYSAIEDEETLVSLEEPGSGSFSATELSVYDNDHSLDAEYNEDPFHDQEAPSLQVDENYGELKPGRRRRLSKRQKRKRTAKLKIMFADEFLCIGNVLDYDSMVTTEGPVENAGPSHVERPVPTLVELCLMASSKVKPSREEGKHGSCLPVGLKDTVINWRATQGFIQKQVAWFQNTVFPACSPKFDILYMMLGRKYIYTKRGDKPEKDEPQFLFTTRSAWDSVPFPVKGLTGLGTSSKAVSFLLCCNLQLFNLSQDGRHPDWRFTSYCNADGVRPLVMLSALATTIDLMMSNTVSEKLFRKASNTELAATQNAVNILCLQIKHALKLRFPRLVEVMFDLALPYVMWARGNIGLATTLFTDLIQNEKRRRQRSLFLSEIARMHSHSGQLETARKFYRLATDVALEKHTGTGPVEDEVIEHFQVLLASLYDQGTFSETNARQAYTSWTSVINLPKQRLESAMAAVESFLCYHCGYWTESSWLEEAVSLLKRVISSHKYFKYYLSLVYALMGHEKESLKMYCDFIFSGSVSAPGLEFRRMYDSARSGNPWKPLIDILKEQEGVAVRPLTVAWRTELTPPRINRGRMTFEADLRSEALNLHLNQDGLLTGDMQMVLPPMRGITLDPYTGCQVVSHVPSQTTTWKGPLDRNTHKTGYHFIPTLREVYSDSKGTKVSLLNPSLDACTLECSNDNVQLDRVPTPLWLYYETESGERVKKNLMTVLKDAAYKRIKIQIEKDVPVSHQANVEKREGLLKMLQKCYDSGVPLNHNAVVSCYSKMVATKEKEKKKNKDKKVKRKSFKDFLPRCSSAVYLLEEPIIYGKTVLLKFEYAQDHYHVFVNCESRVTFLNMKVKERNDQVQPLPYYQAGCCSGGYYVFTDKQKIYVYNGQGELVADFDESGGQTSNSRLFICVIGSCLYIANKTDTSIKKYLIGLKTKEAESEAEEDWLWAGLMDDTDVDTPDVFWPVVHLQSGSEVNIVKTMTVTGNTLLLHFTDGVCFLKADTVSPIPITIAGRTSVSLTSDSTAISGTFDTVRLLEEKVYEMDGQMVTRIALILDYHLAILEIKADSGSQLCVKLRLALALPGLPKDVCFIGRQVGFLVSVSQHTTDDYYREHVLYFNFSGTLCGVLLCLGPGPRSFHPVYLYGDSERDLAHCPPGWYVYLRDGHNGIMGVRLQDNLRQEAL